MPHGADLSDMTHVIDFFQEGVMLLRNISHAIRTGNHDSRAVIPKPVGEHPSPYVVAVQDSGLKLELMFSETMKHIGPGRESVARTELNEAGYPKLTPDE